VTLSIPELEISKNSFLYTVSEVGEVYWDGDDVFVSLTTFNTVAQYARNGTFVRNLTENIPAPRAIEKTPGSIKTCRVADNRR
jgi:hypothetical protein